MKRSTKILWGIATPLPILLIVIGVVCFFAFFVSNIVEMAQHAPPAGLPAPKPGPEFFNAFFKGFFLGYGLILMGVLSGFLVSISYFIHLVRTETVTKDMKTMWVVLFLVFHTL